MQLLAAGPRATVGRYLFHGHAEEGVKWEQEAVILAVVENGQSKRVGLFPGDDAESALAARRDAQGRLEGSHFVPISP